MNESRKIIMKEAEQIDKHLKAIFDICKKLAMQKINLHPQDKEGLINLLIPIDLYFKFGSEQMRMFCRKCRSAMELEEENTDFQCNCWHCKFCGAIYICY